MRSKPRFPLVIKQGTHRVKIYRVANRGGCLYQVTDYTTGRRRLRSFADLEAAKVEAGNIVTKLSNGETEALKLTSADRAAYVRGLDHLKPTGASLELATSAYARAIEILGGDYLLEAARYYAKRNPAKLPRKTVAEVASEFLASKEHDRKTGGKVSDRYLQDLRYRLGRLEAAFDCQLAQVSGSRLQDWFVAEEFSPQSRVNFTRVLSVFIGFAKRKGYLPRDWDELEQVECVKVSPAIIGIFACDEIARLLNAASPEFLPALAIGAFAGLRTAELERLDWREVNFGSGHIEVTAAKAKTASRRLVPLSENLARWLAPYAAKSGAVWRGGKTTINHAQNTTARATADSTQGIPAVRWKRNGLRHSWISYRMALVQNAPQVALEAGNSPAIVFRHYRELVTADEARRWFSIVPEVAVNVVPMAHSP
jgi:integrase